jgi:hypothetical protein
MMGPVKCRNMLEICQRPVNIIFACAVGYTNYYHTMFSTYSVTVIGTCQFPPYYRLAFDLDSEASVGSHYGNKIPK